MDSKVENTVENARIIAEAAMMAQMISKQWSMCTFEYTPDGAVVMDGTRYEVDKYLLIPGTVAWFFDIIPDETMLAMNRLYDARKLGNFDGFDFVVFDFNLIKTVHTILKIEFERNEMKIPDCVTEVWNEDIPF